MKPSDIPFVSKFFTAAFRANSGGCFCDRCTGNLQMALATDQEWKEAEMELKDFCLGELRYALFLGGHADAGVEVLVQDPSTDSKAKLKVLVLLDRFY